MSGKIRVAMVGGGGDATFFGPVHRRAIAGLPGHELVAGALHQDPRIAQEYGEKWGLKHIFTDYREMMKRGAEDDLFDYVVIVTPNNVHYDPAMVALDAGIPVFCEKPLAISVKQGRSLYLTAKYNCVPFGVNYTYNGHWSQKLARAYVRSGVLGDVRRVNAFYWQDWQQKDLGIQQEHRQDPKQSGDFNCNGDINTHNHFAIRNVTGLEVTGVCCVPRIQVEGRVLDDDVDCVHKLQNGGGGLCSASQIACGHENDHRLAVYCANGSVRWVQEESEKLVIVVGNGPDIVIKRNGDPGVSLLDNDKMRELCGSNNVDQLKVEIADIERFLHLPSGHGEDFFVTVGNNHEEFGNCVAEWRDSGKNHLPDGHDYPTVLDGLRGMQFLDACKRNMDGSDKFTTVSLAEG